MQHYNLCLTFVLFAAILGVVASVEFSHVWGGGGGRVFAKSKSGDLYIFGTEFSQPEFYELQIKLSSSVGNIEKVAFSNTHNLALYDDGKILSWGNNQNRELGRYDGSEWTVDPGEIEDVPAFIDVCAGTRFSGAIDADGNIWTWGRDYEHQTGRDTNSRTPGQIDVESKFKSLTCGPTSMTALDEQGNVWGWGTNSGEFNFGDNVLEEIVTPQKLPISQKFSSVSSMGGAVAALDENGNIWQWGKLNEEISPSLTMISDGSVKYEHIECTNGRCSAKDEFGNIWLWGDAGYRLLFAPTISASPFQRYPVKLEISTKVLKSLAISGYTAFITDEGELWSNGLNNDIPGTIYTRSFFPTLVSCPERGSNFTFEPECGLCLFSQYVSPDTVPCSTCGGVSTFADCLDRGFIIEPRRMTSVPFNSEVSFDIQRQEAEGLTTVYLEARIGGIIKTLDSEYDPDNGPVKYKFDDLSYTGNTYRIRVSANRYGDHVVTSSSGNIVVGSIDITTTVANVSDDNSYLNAEYTFSGLFDNIDVIGYHPESGDVVFKEEGLENTGFLQINLTPYLQDLEPGLEYHLSVISSEFPSVHDNFTLVLNQMSFYNLTVDVDLQQLELTLQYSTRGKIDQVDIEGYHVDEDEILLTETGIENTGTITRDISPFAHIFDSTNEFRITVSATEYPQVSNYIVVRDGDYMVSDAESKKISVKGLFSLSAILIFILMILFLE